jgi:dual specificity phosphatase 12
MSCTGTSSSAPCVTEVLKERLFLGKSVRVSPLSPKSVADKGCCSLQIALSAEQKEILSITHIVSVCPEYPSTGLQHLSVPVRDTEYDDLLVHLPKACTFIEDALSEDGRVLVQCVMAYPEVRR